MKIFAKLKSGCFCAFCKSKRQIYSKKHVDIINIALTFAFSACLATALWTWWDPRCLVIFSLGIGLSEAFIYVRWRYSVVCQFCGFDPVTYRRSPELAKAKVAAFYQEKTLDPKFLLGSSPLIALHKERLITQRRNQWVLQQRSATLEKANARNQKVVAKSSPNHPTREPSPRA
jgi:hypothetical protein